MGLVERAKKLGSDFGTEIFINVGTGSSSSAVISHKHRIDNVDYVTIDNIDVSANETTLYGEKQDGTVVALYTGNWPMWNELGRKTFDTSEYVYLYTFSQPWNYYTKVQMSVYTGTLCDNH